MSSEYGSPVGSRMRQAGFTARVSAPARSYAMADNGQTSDSTRTLVAEPRDAQMSRSSIRQELAQRRHLRDGLSHALPYYDGIFAALALIFAIQLHQPVLRLFGVPASAPLQGTPGAYIALLLAVAFGWPILFAILDFTAFGWDIHSSLCCARLALFWLRQYLPLVCSGWWCPGKRDWCFCHSWQLMLSSSWPSAACSGQRCLARHTTGACWCWGAAHRQRVWPSRLLRAGFTG